MKLGKAICWGIFWACFLINNGGSKLPFYLGILYWNRHPREHSLIKTADSILKSLFWDWKLKLAQAPKNWWEVTHTSSKLWDPILGTWGCIPCQYPKLWDPLLRGTRECVCLPYMICVQTCIECMISIIWIIFNFNPFTGSFDHPSFWERPIWMCMSIYVCLCMYVYYVSMYVCMYVCMHLSMYVCMYDCMCVYVCVCMYVRMYVCMNVCMYVYI